MKKGCIIVLSILAVLLLIIVVGAFVAYRVADQRLGLAIAPELHHEDLAVADTRIRLAIYPEKLAPFLADYIPPDVEIPTGAVGAKDILGYVLPREIAVLVRSDILGKKVKMTLFVNEKRFGPFVQNTINASEFFAQVPQINWTSKGFELPERGMLLVEGDVSIPDAVEEEVLELWPTKSKEAPAAITGGNHAELVIDNRDGDILAIAAALVQASGQNWEEWRKKQEATMAIGVIESIDVAHLKANLVDIDTATIEVRIDSDPEKGPGLQFLLSGLVLPFAKDYLKNEQGLILEGELPWNQEESAVVGTLKLTGLEAFIKKQIQNTPAV